MPNWYFFLGSYVLYLYFVDILYLGAVQFIRDCIPLNQITQLIKDGSHEQTRMINTAAGGTIAAFVLGIKDRHDDNTLIGPDGCMFQIDFSYMLGT